MARCEWLTNYPHSQHVDRCQRDGKHYAHIPQADDALVTETIIVCDTHEVLLRDQGIRTNKNVVRSA